MKQAIARALAAAQGQPPPPERAFENLVRRGIVTVGAHSYGSPRVKQWGEGTTLSIGAYSSIAEGVIIFLGGNHRIDWVTTYPFTAFPGTWPTVAGRPGHPATRGNVTIGSDVWIGDGACILSGVSIGHGAVVGARSVVSRDVPPYGIVAGNPAVLQRERFDKDTVELLLDLSWWDWPEERVVENLDALMNTPDVPALRTLQRRAQGW